MLYLCALWIFPVRCLVIFRLSSDLLALNLFKRSSDELMAEGKDFDLKFIVVEFPFFRSLLFFSGAFVFFDENLAGPEPVNSDTYGNTYIVRLRKYTYLLFLYYCI